jgi:hypothetical protein
MPHPQRLEILAAVRRVLRDDGWFAFSSHSIEFRNIVVALDLSAPLTLGGLRRNLKYLRSNLRVHRHQVRTSEYAILSNPRGGTSSCTTSTREGTRSSNCGPTASSTLLF